MNGRLWPFVSVKLSVNVSNRSVGFAPESGRSECACRIELMSAFPKADIQNVRDRVELYGCLWPKADIRSQGIGSRE